MEKPPVDNSNIEETPKKGNLIQRMLGNKNIMKGSLAMKIVTAPTIAAAMSGSPTDKLTTESDTLTKQPRTEQTIAPGDSTEPKRFTVYDKSKTKEGGITPTGMSNSFYENKYGITEDDIDSLATLYGFRTSSAEDFQKDMFDYLVANHPEIILTVIKEYGQTKKGENIKEDASVEEQAEGLNDRLFGTRMAYLLYLLKRLPPPERQEPPAPGEEEGFDQPTGGYVINVRGDEPGSLGLYYFYENEKDFMKVTDIIGGYSSREVRGDNTGKASINMNIDKFLEFHAKQNAALLGKGWTRDSKNPNRFVPLSTTAHYYAGLTASKE